MLTPTANLGRQAACLPNASQRPQTAVVHNVTGQSVGKMSFDITERSEHIRFPGGFVMTIVDSWLSAYPDADGRWPGLRSQLCRGGPKSHSDIRRLSMRMGKLEFTNGMVDPSFCG